MESVIASPSTAAAAGAPAPPPVPQLVPTLGPESAEAMATHIPFVREFADALLNFAAEHGIPLAGPLSLQNGTVGGPAERALVKQWSAQFRQLPRDVQPKLPAHISALARIELALGEYLLAQREFQNLATLQKSLEQQAESRWFAFQAALERGQFPDALVELKLAMDIDVERYAPIPPSLYEPEKLLGADAFGLTLRAQLVGTKGLVVCRTIDLATLARDPEEHRLEAERLAKVDHIVVARIGAVDYTSAEQRQLYILQEFNEGLPLDQHVQRFGPLPVRDVLAVCRTLADALAMCHQAGILHRALRPSSVLLRKELNGWRVVLGDFGLVFHPEAYQKARTNPAALSRTTYGRTITTAQDYTAPELVEATARATTASDTFGLGKLCCFMLFGTPHPASHHWRQLSDHETLAALLEECLAPDASARPADLARLAERFGELAQPIMPVAPTPANLTPDGNLRLVPLTAAPAGVGEFVPPQQSKRAAVRRRVTVDEQISAYRRRNFIIGTGIFLVLAVLIGLPTAYFLYPRPKAAEARVVPASGILRLVPEGRPVPKAKLVLVPERRDGFRAHAETDEKGQFAFTTFNKGDGAYPGKYRVLVIKYVDEEARYTPPTFAMPKEQRPMTDRVGISNVNEVHHNYGDVSRSPLRITIPENGSQELIISINLMGR